MNFFIFCAAANKALLLRCPASEHHKYASIGATIFFTGVLAALSGGYALYTVFNSVPVAIALGLFWGTLIFNLDRFIVSTLKKGGRRISLFIQVIPRLLLAVFLAIVISKPLELRIFQQEIHERLHDAGLEKLEDVSQRYEEKVQTHQAAITALKQKTDERYQLREKYYEDYKCECEGTCGTGARGVGSECLRKEKKYLKADQEYQELKAENNQLIAQLQQEIATLNKERETYQEDLRHTFATGLLAQLDALGHLPAGPSISIVLLLIFVESAPMLAKLLSPFGPYDHLLKTVEYDYEIEEIASINARNQKLNNQLTLLASVEQQKVEQQVMNNKETMHLIEKAHRELIKEQLAIWVEQEKAKLRDEAMLKN